jgi:hypothetical protein
MTTSSTPDTDQASVEVPILDRLCPSWCTSCSGWEDEGRLRTHRRLFPFNEAACVEVYSMESADGTIIAQGAGTPDEVNELSAPELLEYAGALLQAAGFMQAHGIEAVR